MVGCAHPAPAPSAEVRAVACEGPALAITHATGWPMAADSERPSTDATVVVCGDRVAPIGPTPLVAPPPGATTIVPAQLEEVVGVPPLRDHVEPGSWRMSDGALVKPHRREHARAVLAIGDGERPRDRDVLRHPHARSERPARDLRAEHIGPPRSL